jgi:hypothetical protein
MPQNEGNPLEMPKDWLKAKSIQGSYGYVQPKMIRVKMLHIFLWHFVTKISETDSQKNFSGEEDSDAFFWWSDVIKKYFLFFSLCFSSLSHPSLSLT